MTRNHVAGEIKYIGQCCVAVVPGERTVRKSPTNCRAKEAQDTEALEVAWCAVRKAQLMPTKCA